ncbi:4Fe-4S dicluster domain-containing protein [Bacillaceae bacterium IKA-2]|nr:4Fe-4S dicluster domain-containing protein [Bacillaceae bacterium IKA-2]
MTTKYSKLVDVTRCDGCRACMVACKNWNDLPVEPEEFKGSYQSHDKCGANTWNVLTFDEHVAEDGRFEWLFRHSACMHCTDAACVKVCPEDAMHYTEFGTVNTNYDKCVGCGYCVQNCPFGIVQLATLVDEKGKEYEQAQKCTMCIDRLSEGLMPSCVEVCHMDALVYGEKSEMEALAKERLALVKDRYPNANIYNPIGVDGTQTFYLLAEDPSVYGLPENPKVPMSATVWKDYAQPLGKAMLGVTTMAVIGGFISNKLFNKEGEEGGERDE